MGGRPEGSEHRGVRGPMFVIGVHERRSGLPTGTPYTVWLASLSRAVVVGSERSVPHGTQVKSGI